MLLQIYVLYFYFQQSSTVIKSNIVHNYDIALWKKCCDGEINI